MQTQYNILFLTELEEKHSLHLVNDTIDLMEKRAPKLFNLFSQSSKKLPKTLNYDESVPLHYIICIGENKTIMRAFRINTKQGQVPILPISNGTQPILSSYSHCKIEMVIESFIEKVQLQQIELQKSINFSIYDDSTKKLITSFASQLQIFRGMDQSVIRLKLYIKTAQKQFTQLAPFWGDGLIIATPLGSIGRSMSLNGPIMHKQIENLIIVPNCPLSLNFRPICLPKGIQILVEVDEKSRSSAKLFVDGEKINDLPQGRRIRILKSQEESLFVEGLTERSFQEKWIQNLKEVIGWGEQYSSDKTISAILEQEKEYEK